MLIKQRANTPEQKKEVLDKLLAVWLQNPDLRLAQLIGNVYHAPSGNDPYHVEDFDLIKKIVEHYAP